MELKIDAFQSEDQLARYRAVVESEWPALDGWDHRLIFLTRRGEVSNDGWRDIPILSLVKKLENCQQGHDGLPGSSMLRDYTKMLRRHHVGDELTVEMARKLWSEHREVLNFLMENRPQPIKELFETLKASGKEVGEAASAPMRTIIADVHTSSIARFAISEWDTLNGFKTAADWTPSNRLILLEIKPGVGTIDAFAYLGPSRGAARKRFAAELVKAGLLSPSAVEAERWSLLMRAELFRPTDIYSFDRDDALGAVHRAFEQFASKVYDKIGPAISAPAAS